MRLVIRKKFAFCMSTSCASVIFLFTIVNLSLWLTVTLNSDGVSGLNWSIDV